MELLLNALWLFVALVVIAFACAASDARVARGRNHGVRTFVAAGCTALLLFPIISVTDDLSGEQAAVQEAWAATKKLRSYNTAPAAASDAALLPSLPEHRPHWLVVHAVPPETLVKTHSIVLPDIPGRAPPARFL